MAVKLIINADDLGASKGVNSAIFGLMERGLVTSATIMANAPAVDDALGRLKEFPRCSFGAHLNVMDFKPQTDQSAFEKHLDVDGAFTGSLLDAPLDSRLRRAIADEWCAQVALLRDRGVNVSHLDSHYHLHNRPGLFLALKRVQRRFGIRRVRLTKNLYAPSRPAASGALLFKKALWIFALAHYYRTRTTDRFTEFATFLGIASETRLEDQTIEAMVHPGASGCAEETALLKSRWMDMIPSRIELSSYIDL